MMMASATEKWNTTDGKSDSTRRRRDLTLTPAAASRRESSNSIVLVVLVAIFCLWGIIEAEAAAEKEGITPTPRPWPHQFHSILLMNYSGELQIIDLWYDWTNGRNFNIIQEQLANDLLYDLEWNNGTTFFYTFNSSSYCRSSQLDVGILRPNWLEGANYLGQRHVDGFLCNVWEKVDFIWYYEDVLTHRPVHWLFYTGRAAHVMTFEVGAVLEDSKWQAPAYCFEKIDYKRDLEADNTIKMSIEDHLTDRLLRGSLAF